MFSKMLPSLLVTISTIASLTTAQSANAAQSSQITSLLASYTHSIATGPAATALAIEVELQGNVPTSELPSILSGLPALLPSLGPTADLYAFAKAPTLTFSEPAWVTALPSSVRADVEGFRTSIVVAEASIVGSVLGVSGTAAATSGQSTAGTTTATATASTIGTTMATATASTTSATAAAKSGAAAGMMVDAVSLGAFAGVAAAVGVVLAL